MNEQLTPLEVSKQLKDFVLEFVKNDLDKRFIHGSFDTIETALKDCEKQKDYYAKLLESVLNDKEHKALEIIKEKNVNTFLVRQCKNYIEYNRALANQGVVGARHFNLTKEEFDLLKEVLK